MLLMHIKVYAAHIDSPLVMYSNLKSSSSDYAFDIDEVLRIGTMCMELRKEKDMLRDSQLESAELIRELKLDVKALSEDRLVDKQNIQELEKELRKCYEQMGTLQEQVNLRTIESNWLGEHVHSLELKLKEMNKLPEKVNQLRDELLKSNSDRLFLMRELENKEMELRNSKLYIEKLEEVIASIALDSECEIEGMKLDLINMEQMSTEARKFQERTTQEKAKMDGLIEEFAEQIQDSHKAIKLLEDENRDLRNKVEASENVSRIFVRRIEEYLKMWLEKKSISQINIQSSNKKANELHPSKEIGICEEVLGPLLSKLAVVAATDENSKDEMERMAQQIHEYERVVEQLKNELREEKLKAKEEAEDLTQEMAELRYRITGMLEDECKRRAHIEQASLQRITELESQALKEQKRSFLAVKQLTEAQKLAESRSREIHHLKSLLKGSCTKEQSNEACRSCISSSEERSEAKYIVDNVVMNNDKLGQLSIACILEEPDHEDKSIVLSASNNHR